MRMRRDAAPAAPRSAPPPPPACAHMAHRFIVGERPAGRAAGAARACGSDGIADLGRPARRGDRHRRRGRRATPRAAPRRSTTLAAATRRWPDRPLLERDSLGPLPRANLSVKVSALTPLLRPEAPERGSATPPPRLRALLRRARELGAHLHIDMESLDSREASLELVLDLLAEDEFRDGPSAGLVLQAYLRDSPRTLVDRIARLGARRRRARTPLVVRLVKGAYWDHEVVEARQHGWTSPVFEDKADCDRNFEALTRRLLDAAAAVRAGDRLAQPALGRPRDRRQPRAGGAPTATSSSRSCAASATTSATRSPRAACACAPTARSATSSPAWPTSCAACSRTPRTSRFLADAGARRRRLERAAGRRRDRRTVRQRAGRSSCAAPPRASARRRAGRARRARCRCACPCWIGDDRAAASRRSSRPTPARPTASSRAPRARRRPTSTPPSAPRPPRRPALGRARRPPSAPRSLAARRRLDARAPPASSPRSRCASARSRGREADADVCEAIDFLEYYARGAIALDARRRAAAGARRAQRAALRAARRRRGDRAVELPARDPDRDDRGGARDRQRRRAQARRAVARLRRSRVVEALRAGRRARRRDRAAARRGRGRRGARRATRACTTIAFTGSGAGRPRDPARPPPSVAPGQRHLKRVVAEMGGKNCVIVDADADLDEAVPAIVAAPRSATPARSARPPRACSSTRRSPTRCVERLAGARRRSLRRPGRRLRRPTSRR